MNTIPASRLHRVLGPKSNSYWDRHTDMTVGHDQRPVIDWTKRLVATGSALVIFLIAL